MTKWTKWKPMPSPETCRLIDGPQNEKGQNLPGVYQIRNAKENSLIQFGIGKECRKRMKSLYPSPFGTGRRNNVAKREYVLKNWKYLEYRTLATATRAEAKVIEDKIKAKKNHLFNT